MALTLILDEERDCLSESSIVFLKAHGCATGLNTARNPKERFNRQLDNWKDQIGIITSSMNPPVEQRVVKKLQIAAIGRKMSLLFLVTSFGFLHSGKLYTQ